jgi:hypothetical protein
MDSHLVYVLPKKLLQNFICEGEGYTKYFKVNVILALISKYLHDFTFQSDFNKFLNYGSLLQI